MLYPRALRGVLNLGVMSGLVRGSGGAIERWRLHGSGAVQPLRLKLQTGLLAGLVIVCLLFALAVQAGDGVHAGLSGLDA